VTENATPEKAKRGRGRPTDFNPEYVRQAEKLCALGATDEEIADFFGVQTRTIYRWKAAHPEFSQAIKTAKELADERVERSLYQRACGYETDAVKIFMPASASKPVYAEYKEKVAADTTAAIFWLKNRRKETWADTKDVNVNMSLSDQFEALLAEIHENRQKARLQVVESRALEVVDAE
jgi:transposase